MYSSANGDDWSRDDGNTRNCSVKSEFKYANTVDDVFTSETLLVPRFHRHQSRTGRNGQGENGPKCEGIEQ